MKKRKTREEKIRARLREQAPAKQMQSTNPTFEFVKREFNEARRGSAIQNVSIEKQEISAQISILASTKRDLVKTFVLASTIFAAELVLYLAWN